VVTFGAITHARSAMASRSRPTQSAYESATYLALQVRLARAVRGRRVALGLSQEELAHRCGLATRLLQRVEAGAVNLTFTTLARVCDGLGVDAAELLAAPAAASRATRPRARR